MSKGHLRVLYYKGDIGLGYGKVRMRWGHLRVIKKGG